MRKESKIITLKVQVCLTVLLACGACSSDPDENANGQPATGLPMGGAAGTPGTAGMSGTAGTTNTGTAGVTGAGSGGAAGTAGAGMAGSGGTAAGSGGTEAGSGGTAGEMTAGAGGEIVEGEHPFVPTGEPITAPDMAWTWVGFPDTKCRDGSAAGVAVSMNSASDKVMIFLQGGGACFDSLTCLANPVNVNGMMTGGSAGVFDRSNAMNPVKDWNYVFVPYCTGDVHLGTKDDGMVTGVTGVQHFVGRLNIEKYLNRLVPTFAQSSQVLLTGVSAGGFGAAANMELVQWAFGDVPVTAIDDSGPPMSSEYVPECLQQKWRETWGFENSVLKDCGADCPNENDYDIAYSLHVAHEFPDHMGGLIETTADGTISLFYGYGTNNCAQAASIPAAKFKAGLLDYRTTIMAETDRLGTYFIEGSQHTWLAGASFYTQTVGGVKMVDWFRDIVEGRAAAHVGP